MLTTWPAFTEAMYLLGEAGGWQAQNTLWSLTENGDLDIVEQSQEQRTRCRTLMSKVSRPANGFGGCELGSGLPRRRIFGMFSLWTTLTSKFIAFMVGKPFDCGHGVLINDFPLPISATPLTMTERASNPIEKGRIPWL